MPLILGTNSIKDTGYNVANSCRFDDGSSDYLERGLTATGNQKKWTWSAWVKVSKIGAGDRFLWSTNNSDAGGGNFTSIQLEADAFRFYNYSGGAFENQITTNRKLKDSSAWYHLMVVYDSANSTADDRIKMYVNGVQETSFSTRTNPSLNQNSYVENTYDMYIGTQTGTESYFDGYMTEIVFINDATLDPTSFGEFDSDTDIWKPIDVSGLTFGTNGFYLDFENSSSLGADVSGNGNNFTVNNLTSIDQSTDTCTNNAVTFTTNHPTANNFTISQGGLKINKSGSGTFGLYGSSIMLSSGKWYWEVKFTGDAGSDRTRAGIAHYDSVSGTSTIQDSYSGFEFTCTTSGRFSFTTVGGSATEINGFNGYSTGDIIRFALDMDNQRLYVGRNADWFNYSSSATGGDPTSGSGWLINDTTILKAPQTIYAGHAVGVSGSSELEFNFGATNTFTVSSGNSDGNGYGNFEYSVPSGYYAINTKNLAEYG